MNNTEYGSIQSGQLRSTCDDVDNEETSMQASIHKTDFSSPSKSKQELLRGLWGIGKKKEPSRIIQNPFSVRISCFNDNVNPVNPSVEDIPLPPSSKSSDEDDAVCSLRSLNRSCMRNCSDSTSSISEVRKFKQPNLTNKVSILSTCASVQVSNNHKADLHQLNTSDSLGECESLKILPNCNNVSPHKMTPSFVHQKLKQSVCKTVETRGNTDKFYSEDSNACNNSALSKHGNESHDVKPAKPAANHKDLSANEKSPSSSSDTKEMKISSHTKSKHEACAFSSHSKRAEHSLKVSKRERKDEDRSSRRTTHCGKSTDKLENHRYKEDVHSRRREKHETHNRNAPKDDKHTNRRRRKRSRSSISSSSTGAFKKHISASKHKRDHTRHAHSQYDDFKSKKARHTGRKEKHTHSFSSDSDSHSENRPHRDCIKSSPRKRHRSQKSVSASHRIDKLCTVIKSECESETIVKAGNKSSLKDPVEDKLNCCQTNVTNSANGVTVPFSLHEQKHHGCELSVNASKEADSVHCREDNNSQNVITPRTVGKLDSTSGPDLTIKTDDVNGSFLPNNITISKETSVPVNCSDAIPSSVFAPHLYLATHSCNLNDCVDVSSPLPYSVPSLISTTSATNSFRQYDSYSSTARPITVCNGDDSGNAVNFSNGSIGISDAHANRNLKSSGTVATSVSTNSGVFRSQEFLKSFDVLPDFTKPPPVVIVPATVSKYSSSSSSEESFKKPNVSDSDDVCTSASQVNDSNIHKVTAFNSTENFTIVNASQIADKIPNNNLETAENSVMNSSPIAGSLFPVQPGILQTKPSDDGRVETEMLSHFEKDSKSIDLYNPFRCDEDDEEESVESVEKMETSLINSNAESVDVTTELESADLLTSRTRVTYFNSLYSINDIARDNIERFFSNEATIIKCPVLHDTRQIVNFYDDFFPLQEEAADFVIDPYSNSSASRLEMFEPPRIPQSFHDDKLSGLEHFDLITDTSKFVSMLEESSECIDMELDDSSEESSVMKDVDVKIIKPLKLKSRWYQYNEKIEDDISKENFDDENSNDSLVDASHSQISCANNDDSNKQCVKCEDNISKLNMQGSSEVNFKRPFKKFLLHKAEKIRTAIEEHLLDVPPSFEEIDENVWLCERPYMSSKEYRASKGHSKSMLCDCSISAEERAQGIPACGERCLNRMLMIECGPGCRTGEFCTNRRFTRKECIPLVTFHTDCKGWGVRSITDIEPGEFIIEYVGEVLDLKTFKERLDEYTDAGRNQFYFMSPNADVIIDATKKGNLSRFINHSCDPNCETQKWTVNGEIRIGLFAIKRISAGEEICFDYQYETIGNDQVKCYCNAQNCRGFIGNKCTSGRSWAKIFDCNYLKFGNDDNGLTFDFSNQSKFLELERLPEQLKEPKHLLKLNQLMVTAERLETRLLLLEKLLTARDDVCYQLFIDYHGLTLLWSWMIDLNGDSPLVRQLQLKIIEVLTRLPIRNRSLVEDSKIIRTVEQWSQMLDWPYSSHNSIKEIVRTLIDVTIRRLDRNVRKLARNSKMLYEKWTSLTDTFRIPKSTRVNEMKLHEVQMERLSAAVSKKGEKYREKGFRVASNVGRRSESNSSESNSLSTACDDNRTKMVKKNPSFEDIKRDLTDGMKGKSVENVTDETQKKNSLVNTTVVKSEPLSHDVDESPVVHVSSPECETYPSIIKEELVTADSPEMISFPVSPVAVVRDLKQTLITTSNTSIQPAPPCIPVSVPLTYSSTFNQTVPPKYTPVVPASLNLTKPPPPPPFVAGQKFQASGPSKFSPSPFQFTKPPPTFMPNTLPATNVPPPFNVPPPNYYQTPSYVPKIDVSVPPPPPPALPPLQPPLPPAVPCGNQILIQNISQAKTETISEPTSIILSSGGSAASALLPCATAALPADIEEAEIRHIIIRDPHTGTQQVIQQIIQKQNVSPKKESRKRKRAERNKNKDKDDIPPPPPETSPTKHKRNSHWKVAKTEDGKTYYYHTVTRVTQWEPPSLDEIDASETSSHASSNKSNKDEFKEKLSKLVLRLLTPYLKSDCKVGRITCTDDFKYLARKFTHSILEKEKQRCGDSKLEVNKRVKIKGEEYVTRYMSKFGKEYSRRQDFD